MPISAKIGCSAHRLNEWVKKAEVDSGSLVRFGGDRFHSIQREMHYLCYRTADENDRKISRFRDWVLAES